METAPTPAEVAHIEGPYWSYVKVSEWAEHRMFIAATVTADFVLAGDPALAARAAKNYAKWKAVHQRIMDRDKAVRNLHIKWIGWH